MRPSRLSLSVALAVATACRSPAIEAAPSASASAPSPPSVSASPTPPSPPSATPPPPAPRRSYAVAALGDSLTDTRAGGGLYLKELSRLCPRSRFVSFGKGGDMVNQMRRRFTADVFDGAPGSAGFTHLIVFGGVNDLYSDLTAGRTVEKITRDLQTIYAEARGRGLQVVAVTVAPWGGFTRYFNASRSASTAALNRWILAQRGTRVDFAVDAHPLLSCGDPELLCPDYAKPHKDGLHFGPQGHKKLAEALQQAVFHDCL